MFAPVDVPYEFDGPYAGCYCNPAIAIDRRHVYTLFEVLANFPCATAVEVGCAHGASTTAFVESMRRRPELRCWFIEPTIQESLRHVLGNIGRPRYSVLQQASVAALPTISNPEFIFLDGRHDFLTVSREVEIIARNKPLVIAGHDTSATDNGYEHAEGARHLKRTVMLDWGWHCIEDNMQREGEETHRGLFMATPSHAIYRYLLGAFRKWCADAVPVMEVACG